MSRGIFDNHGIVKTRQIEVIKDTKHKYRKPVISKEAQEAAREERDFCLNCTQPSCRYGECDELKEHMRRFRDGQKAKR